jgi:hypothetical protein
MMSDVDVPLGAAAVFQEAYLAAESFRNRALDIEQSPRNLLTTEHLNACACNVCNAGTIQVDTSGGAIL